MDYYKQSPSTKENYDLLSLAANAELSWSLIAGPVGVFGALVLPTPNADTVEGVFGALDS